MYKICKFCKSFTYNAERIRSSLAPVPAGAKSFNRFHIRMSIETKTLICQLIWTKLKWNILKNKKNWQIRVFVSILIFYIWNLLKFLAPAGTGARGPRSVLYIKSENFFNAFLVPFIVQSLQLFIVPLLQKKFKKFISAAPRSTKIENLFFFGDAVNLQLKKRENL